MSVCVDGQTQKRVTVSMVNITAISHVMMDLQRYVQLCLPNHDSKKHETSLHRYQRFFISFFITCSVCSDLFSCDVDSVVSALYCFSYNGTTLRLPTDSFSCMNTSTSSDARQIHGTRSPFVDQSVTPFDGQVIRVN